MSTTLAVLEQLEPYGKRGKVLEFMKTQFGTSMVKQLDERALKRTHAYAQKVLRNEKDKGAA